MEWNGYGSIYGFRGMVPNPVYDPLILILGLAFVNNAFVREFKA